jgi:carboxymethylenebutenolidase
VGELNETQRYFIDEHVEDYMDGQISRRELLRRVTLISGSAALAATIVAACGTPAPSGAGGVATQSTVPSAAATAFVPQAYATPPAAPVPDGVTVKETDPRITVSKPEVKGSDGASLMAYMAKPNTGARVPGIVVIHENRGQTEHIRDVVRRVATAGFVGINIDLVARAGGAEKLADSAGYNAELAKRTLTDKLGDHNATLAFLKSQSTGAIGVVGFCFGGGETWNLVAAGTDLKAAVPFYGPQPANFAEIAKTKSAVSAVYAEQDTRITGTAPQMEEQLKKAAAPYLITVYPGVNHAFHNDTGERYNAAQAQKAWVATIEWFRKYLA